MTSSNIEEVVIVINPGSTSTKFALWTRDKSLEEKTVRHDTAKLAENLVDQEDYRFELINENLKPLLSGRSVVGAVGRGGLLKPLQGGTYKVNAQMLDDLRKGIGGVHASNLGAILANRFAKEYSVPAYIVDPVVVDEFHDVARISGVKWIVRKSRSHALNIKATMRRACRRLNKKPDEANFVVAHMGGGTSIAAVQKGKIIDVNDALLGMGPFSPERAGALPIGPLVDACFSGKYSHKEMIKMLSKQSGLYSYCGTADALEVENRFLDGDKDAEKALRAMMYQNAKEIGAMASVLSGKVDAIVLTGGLANSKVLMDILKGCISWISEVLLFPGEGELQALAEGAFRVLDNIEEPKDYH